MSLSRTVSMYYELKDKVVLITGAANGIGAAFVKLLVTEKVKHVRVLDIDEDAGVFIQNELNNSHGVDKVKFTKCDVTNDDELFRAFNDTREHYGYIDLVVNNAGLANESNSEYVRKEIEVNVKALVNGTIKALELMRTDKGGRGGTVINVSSVAALMRQSPLLFVYAATKSAVLHFSNCIGKEPYHSKTGVRVITICFGPTKTGIMDKLESFDENIKMQELMDLLPMQTTEVAAQGALEAYKTGESGSTWLIHNGKPAKDITSTINKAYADMTSQLEDD